MITVGPCKPTGWYFALSVARALPPLSAASDGQCEVSRARGGGFKRRENRKMSKSRTVGLAVCRSRERNRRGANRTEPRAPFRIASQSALNVILTLTLVHCAQPLPQEPETLSSQVGSDAVQHVESRTIERSDGNPPDTVAFLARIVNWDQMSGLYFQVESDWSILHSGDVASDQLQVVFEYNPGADTHLWFSAWSAGTDTTRVEWVHRGTRSANSGS